MKQSLFISLIILNSVCWSQKKPIVLRDSDTAVMAMRIFSGSEHEDYQKLTVRGKYIFDSLGNLGITTLQLGYLSYEPFYMKQGSKIEKFKQVRGNRMFIMEYLFWNKNGGFGSELKKEYEIK